MSFSRRIREMRTKNNLKQQEVADALSITRACYTNYETGQRFPNQDMLIKISDFYKVSLDYLIKGEKPQSIDAIIKPIPVINEFKPDEKSSEGKHSMRLALLPADEPDKYFFYKVDNSSMCSGRIDKGDMLMFYRDQNISEDDVCLVLVDKMQYILGRLKTVGDLMLIKPLNTKNNIFVSNKSDIISGKVKVLGKALTGEYSLNLAIQAD